MKKLVLLFLFISSFSYSQQAYYNDVNLTLTGTALRDELAIKIINTHTNSLSYTPGIWEACKVTDLDPSDITNSNVLLVYGYSDIDGNYVTDRTRSKTLNGGTAGTQWNREHSYPKSLGTPNLGTSGPGSDAHHLRASDITMNGNRGSLKFASGSGNAGSSNGGWYPGDEWKGDAARMMMYMYLRYGNQCLPSGVAIGSTNAVDSNMIDLLLDWNAQDPVSTYEDNRNTYHENTSNAYAQGNRNPFIDNPNLATQIWGGTVAEDRWNITPDTQAPTAPTNLIASNITNTTVDLNWTASTDDVGVTSYAIFVDGLSYASSATNSATLTGLTQNTSYAITVYAKDAAGNTSTVSNTVNITTTNIIDNSAPTVPTNLVVSNETSTTLDLAWTASTDNVGVTGYDVYVDGIFNATTAATTYTITGLSPTTTYSLTVLAKDGAANSSAQSTPVNGTTTAVSSTCASETFTNSNAPSGGYGDGSFIGDNSITWTYLQSRDDEGYVITGTGLMLRNTSSKLTSSTVTGGIGDFTCSLKKAFTGTGNRQVELFINGASYGTSIAWDNTTVQTFTVSNINITGGIIVEIRNTTAYQVVIDDLSWTCFTGTADTQAPTTIVDLSASNTTSTTTDLAWSASTDNVGVTSYEIFKDGVFLASTATNIYNVTGLIASTSYNFTVYTKDTAGNTSLVSNTIAVTTTAAASGATELFISEYVEGSGTNKAIEIANFTGSSIDLSIYSLKRNTNGSATWGAPLALSGILINGDVFVASNSSDPTILAATDLSSATDALLFNGNDPVGLFKNNVLIDIVGTFNGGSANFAKDVTKRRIGTITSPNTTYTLSEWIDFAIDTYDGLGSHNVTLSTYEFIPNLFNVYPNPTQTNRVTISVKDSYEINTVQLYNLVGQLVIDIQQPIIIQNRIEVTNIPSGMYIIKIANKKAFSTKRLLVK